MKRTWILLLILSVLAAPDFSVAGEDMKLRDADIKGFIPKKGFVPDADTAVKIAVAILIPIYGEQVILSELPFTASLSNDVWIVTGAVPTGHVGGVAEIRISKTTARVIRVMHSK